MGGSHPFPNNCFNGQQKNDLRVQAGDEFEIAAIAADLNEYWDEDEADEQWVGYYLKGVVISLFIGLTCTNPLFHRLMLWKCNKSLMDFNNSINKCKLTITNCVEWSMACKLTITNCEEWSMACKLTMANCELTMSNCEETSANCSEKLKKSRKNCLGRNNQVFEIKINTE
jgi:hypothetical protein